MKKYIVTGGSGFIGSSLVKKLLAEGGTLRRCPDISKLKQLGFNLNTPLVERLDISKNWYIKNKDLRS